MIRPHNTDCDIVAAEFEGADKRGWLKFDREDITNIKSLKCIAVGVVDGGQDCNVLVIRRLGNNLIYERVGFGTIQRRYVSVERIESQVQII
jgi:hypothetical protein